MTVALSDLTARLEDVVSGLTSDQVERAVRAAVATFGNRAGRLKRGSLSVVSGMGSYALADDFIKIVRLVPMNEVENVNLSGGGIIDLGTAFQGERYQVTGRTLTIYPTPRYTTTRLYWYKAGHIADDDDVYTEMLEEEAEIVMVKAQANALRVLASGRAGDGWKYTIGDVSVDKTNQAKSLREEARGLDGEFDELVSAYVGPVGTRGTYTAAEQAAYGNI